MRTIRRLGLAAVLLGAASGAHAQYYDDGYDAPPPRRAYPRRYAAPVERAGGFNCDAVQPGMTGPHPFSCPLPGLRPLGARCFCDTPLSPLGGGERVVGHVVP